MLFYVTNKNPDIAFPALLKSGFDVIMQTADSGATEMMIDLNYVGDLLSVDSACRMCNEWYQNMTLTGNRITLNEGSKYNAEET